MDGDGIFMPLHLSICVDVTCFLLFYLQVGHVIYLKFESGLSPASHHALDAWMYELSSLCNLMCILSLGDPI